MTDHAALPEPSSLLSRIPDRSGRLFITGGLALVRASLPTGVHRITQVTRRIAGFDLRCSLALTGGVRRVTGGVPVSF